MNIAVIQRFLPGASRGGVGVFTDGLCNALAARRHSVTVFSQDPAPSGARYQVVRVPTAKSGIGRTLAPLSFPFQIARQDFRSFDVIHAQGDDHLLHGAGRPPVVRTMHGTALAEAMFNGWRERSPKRFALHLYFYGCELVAALRADALVAVSHDTTRFYPRTAAVISNGIDLTAFSGTLSDKSKVPTILFVGEVHSRKRGWLLVKIFQEQIRPEIPDAKLWVVSPDALEGDGIECFNRPTTEELAALYRSAWVMCLPSSYEGFGRPYVEAIASAAVAVASPNPGAREVLDGGRCGIIADDEELGPSLCTLLRDADLRAEYVRRGLERASLFSWDRVARAYEEIYAQMAERAPVKTRPLPDVVS